MRVMAKIEERRMSVGPGGKDKDTSNGYDQGGANED
jgi:hypothetical protein